MIREYQIKDTDALVAVWRSASELAHPFLNEGFLAQEEKNLRTIYLPNAETWVVEDNETPIGFIALIEDEIGGLFLNPSFHGKGWGKAMVDHAVDLKGSLRVEVFERNTIGRRFYDRYGFDETGRYWHEASVELTLKLKSD